MNSGDCTGLLFWYLDEGALGELLVDLWFVHDVLGPAGVLQGAQCLLDTEGLKVTAVSYQHNEHLF